MQLATSQRPHPPPVPPRPSRQVVAEALKRSPRPPCPTRQAPPPPNTKPWRSDQQKQQQQQQQKQQQQQQQQVCPAAGRTVIYESAKDCIKECKDENVSDDKNLQDRRQIRATLDGNVPDNRQEIAAEQCKSNNGKEQYDTYTSLEKSQALCSTGNVLGNGLHKRNDPINDQRPRSPEVQRKNSRGKDQDSLSNHRRKSSPHKDKIKETITSIEKIEASPVAAIPRERSESTTRSHIVSKTNLPFKNEHASTSPNSKSGGRILMNHLERRSECLKTETSNKCDTRSTIATSELCPDEPKEVLSISSEKTIGNGTEAVACSTDRPTNVPDIDRATTILVVDEAERKITPSDVDSDNDNANDNENDNNIHRQNWLEAGVRYSSTQITLHGDEDAIDGDRVNGYDHHEEERITDLDFISIQEKIAMSSLQGLPPLPRSLSGFNLNSGRSDSGEPPPPPTRSSSKSQRSGKMPLQSSSRPSPPARQLTTLDTQLAVLRREMFGLRQLDLSLLSQLWSLNESIQEFRQLLQEQEDRAPSPSPSSEEGDDTSYETHPPPPPRRPAPTLHHHRPPRPPRPPRPAHSDESPSSEEYGAV